MRKILLIVVLCLVLLLGWYIWGEVMGRSGEDHFDESFWQEFDTEFVVEHIDILRESGYFRCAQSAEIHFPDEVAIWPKDSDMNSRVQGIVEVNEDGYYVEGRNGGTIYWETSKQSRKYYEDWQSDEKMAYKYLYNILLTAPRGQIWLRLAADTRKECMEMARRELLWVMGVAKGEVSDMSAQE